MSDTVVNQTPKTVATEDTKCAPCTAVVMPSNWRKHKSGQTGTNCRWLRMTCQATVWWDPATCLMFNCIEMFAVAPAVSIVDDTVVNKKAQRFNYKVLFISTHLFFQYEKNDKIFTFQLENFTLMPKKCSHFRSPCCSKRNRMRLPPQTRPSQKKSATKALFSMCSKSKQQSWSIYASRVQKHSMNHHIVALFTQGAILAWLAVPKYALFASIFWCQETYRSERTSSLKLQASERLSCMRNRFSDL